MCIRDSPRGVRRGDGWSEAWDGTPWLMLVEKQFETGQVEGRILVSPWTAFDGVFPMNGTYFFPVSYTHLRAHETPEHLVCRLLLEKKKNNKHKIKQIQPNIRIKFII
eukprot:TRINITY_DN56989_c0_g1_i1.p1 TRINITY_DN56989_c0_g1~~TRINITY_DN56989_c0_g1_i1.p1  ORF type:complete len:108 (+),score=14.17 TRINITY_DN56989_c0_g1_i1:148-471(+)